MPGEEVDEEEAEAQMREEEIEEAEEAFVAMSAG